jgi:hypothetical protein
MHQFPIDKRNLQKFLINQTSFYNFLYNKFISILKNPNFKFHFKIGIFILNEKPESSKDSVYIVACYWTENRDFTASLI